MPVDNSAPLPGWILIDRCGKHFGTILNYLRDGAVPLPESRREIEELLAEAKYYLVQGLVDECQAALQVGTEDILGGAVPCKALQVDGERGGFAWGMLSGGDGEAGYWLVLRLAEDFYSAKGLTTVHVPPFIFPIIL